MTARPMPWSLEVFRAALQLHELRAAIGHQSAERLNTSIAPFGPRSD